MYSPLKGEIFPLSQFEDPLFATEQVGKGIAVNPDVGEVYAPSDGEITSLFPTNHAIGITTESGAEILIFIGVDAIRLNGEYFTSHVKQGDRVNRGDLLLEFDMEKIKALGYPVTTAVVVTNSEQYLDVKTIAKNKVGIHDPLLNLLV